MIIEGILSKEGEGRGQPIGSFGGGSGARGNIEMMIPGHKVSQEEDGFWGRGGGFDRSWMAKWVSRRLWWRRRM